MGKEVVNLNVTKTGTYFMTVQLDESISLEDLDQINFEDLVIEDNLQGEDTFDSTWEEETDGKGQNYIGRTVPMNRLSLDDSGQPVFVD